MRVKRHHAAANGRLPRAVILAAGAALALSVARPAAAAPGDDANLREIGLDAAEARPLDDADLGHMRGRFVSADGQQILYFGLVAASNIQNQSGSTLSAGVAFGVNLKSGNPQVVTNATWAVQQGPGVADNGSGSPGVGLGAMSGGVGQVLQMTGEGNQGLNQAAIDMTNAAPGALMPNGIPSGAPCGSLCQASISGSGVQVLVNMPGQGDAAQAVGPQLILQGVNLNGDMMQASNSMNMVIQLGPQPSISTAGLSTILQSIPPSTR